MDTFREKFNLHKSARMHMILTGKDLVTTDDLNKGRLILGLSTVKETIEVEAILEMIEILRANNN